MEKLKVARLFVAAALLASGVAAGAVGSANASEVKPGTASTLSTSPSRVRVAQPSVAAPADCPKGYFCGYKQANLQDLGFRYQDCGAQEIPDGMGTGGSWYNNQTTGTETWFLGKTGNYLSSAGGAPSWDLSGSWGPVWYTDNIC